MSAPRRKRFNQKQRLQAGGSWLKNYHGHHVVRGYRKYFGVDWPTAFRELELLGVAIPVEYKETVTKCLAGMAAWKKQRKAAKLSPATDPDQDEHFAFIAGYTDGGAPYGITWEEVE